MPDPPRRVYAINEELVGSVRRHLHVWLLAPSGVWKLVGAGRSMDVTNYVPFSPPGFLGRATAKKRICIQPRDPWVDGLWVWVDCWPRVTSFSVSRDTSTLLLVARQSIWLAGYLG